MKRKKAPDSLSALEKEMLLQVEDLKMSLGEAQETLRAVRTGCVDGLMVKGPNGERVLTLKQADVTYRVLVEAMHEGAMALTEDGVIVYCNRRFASMVGGSGKELMGSNIFDWFAPEDREMVVSVMGKARAEAAKAEVRMRRREGGALPVYISVSPLPGDRPPTFCAVVTDLTELAEATAALTESEKRCRYLAQELLVAQENERRLIAQDIHDSLGSSLGNIKMTVERIPADKKTEEELQRVADLVQEAMHECRRIQMALRPAILDDFGIVVTLNWLCRELQEAHPRLKVEKRLETVEADVPEDIKVVMYRICQEALNNVIKHSGGDSVTLALSRTGDGTMELSIRDNGRGFDAMEASSRRTHGRGMGLGSMRERAELSGGAFSIVSEVGRGTIVRASWPLRKSVRPG